MIEILAALALQTAQADAIEAVECQVIAEGERNRVRALRARCDAIADGIDADAVQAAADQLVARVDLPFRVPLGLSADVVDRSLTLVRQSDGRWDIAFPVQLRIGFYTASSRGLSSPVMCAGRAMITPSGTIEDPDWRCNRRARNGEIREDRSVARRMADQMAGHRWILPLGLEEGCAEVSENEMDQFAGPAPGVAEADRPNCNSFPLSAVHQRHPMQFPLAARDVGYTAECDVLYDYDAQGFVHTVDTRCTLISPSGERLERSQDAEIRITFEEVVNRSIGRTRLEPADPPFEGLRDVEREVGFSLTEYDF